jgi:hypothetical protein
MFGEAPTQRVDACFAGPAPAPRVRLASGVRRAKVAQKDLGTVGEARIVLHQ